MKFVLFSMYGEFYLYRDPKLAIHEYQRSQLPLAEAENENCTMFENNGHKKSNIQHYYRTSSLTNLSFNNFIKSIHSLRSK